MKAASGDNMWGKFVYQEVVPPEKLVFISSFSDEQGSTAPPPFSEEFPTEIMNTLLLTEQAGRTTVSLRGIPLNATEDQHRFFQGMNASMQQGWKGTLDKLEAYLAKV
jgi:uncharacterized protein YndB with AHSA1/START domain